MGYPLNGKHSHAQLPSACTAVSCKDNSGLSALAMQESEGMNGQTDQQALLNFRYKHNTSI